MMAMKGDERRGGETRGRDLFSTGGTPPLFLWGGVVVAPSVMGLAGHGPPSVVTLGAIGLCIALGFCELASRGGRMLSVLLALLYIAAARLLSGPAPGLWPGLAECLALTGGAALGALAAWAGQNGRGGRWTAGLLALVYFLLLEWGALSSRLAGLLAGASWPTRSLWASALLAFALAAGVALFHAQMLRLGRMPRRTSGHRALAIEVLSVAVGLGLVSLLMPRDEGLSPALALSLCLLLCSAALHRDIGPRVIGVTLLLYFAATASPFGRLSLAEAAIYGAMLALALVPTARFARQGGADSDDPLWFTALQPLAEAWVVVVDLARQEMVMGPAAEAEFGGQRLLSSWLSQLPAAEATALIALLQGTEIASAADAPLLLTLRRPGGRGSAPYRLHLLDRQGVQVRLLLCRAEVEETLRAELAEGKAELDRIRLREERLLAIASHELRTPVATLTMLAEEIDSGEPWEELAPSLREATGQVLAVLDDLRARGPARLGGLAADRLALEQISGWIAEEFRPLAQSLAVTLEVKIPEQRGPLYHCETGRLMLVLDKLLRHAMTLPGLQRLRLTLVMLPQERDRATLVWTLLPEAAAPLAMPAEQLFTPFLGANDAGLGPRLQGVGLYTARKAAEAMAGDLRVQSDPAGFMFVFTHPVRRVLAAATADREVG